MKNFGIAFPSPDFMGRMSSFVVQMKPLTDNMALVYSDTP